VIGKECTEKKDRCIITYVFPRLIGIADISCDINGGVEFMHKSTSIDRPTFVYDFETGAIHDG
jgi:hypothetical protein